MAVPKDHAINLNPTAAKVACTIKTNDKPPFGGKLPTVKPFKAIRYNTKKIHNLSSVVAPPYDVIPKKMQDELYRKSPHNIVRLILNKITPKDTEEYNRYTRSKKIFDAWLDEKILTRDDADSFYIYSQKYKQGSKNIEQIGFIGLMSLEMDGNDKVLPHENTLAAPKQDRLSLICAVKANLSPIFILHDYKDVTKLLKGFRAKNEAVINIKCEGVHHIVWKLSDPKIINAIKARIDTKNLFIADGHHRYEVAKIYAREAVGENSKYMMVYFVEADEKMLTVLPTHRLIKDLGNIKKDDIIDKLKKFFYIEKATHLKGMMLKLKKLADKHAFGMCLGKSSFYILTLKSIKTSDDAIKDKPNEWKRLDVSILHLFIFQHILGISDTDDNIEFVKDPLETVKAVNSGKSEAAFFLNPTKVSEVKEIARLGERMPRKSTYFYPKPLSGLVINKH